MFRLVVTSIALLVTACTAADTGSVEVSLTGHGRSGTAYRLRQAELVITGGAERVFRTEDNPDLTRISAQLAPGPYALRVADGWFLERGAVDGTFAPISAVLTSPNPAAFTITEGGETRVTLRFLAGADDVPLDDGALGIDIEIDEVDAAVPDAAIDAAPDAAIDAGLPVGLGPWTGNDVVPPSQLPPFGIPPAQVPQLVVLGFEDNGYSGLPGSNGVGGMSWLTDLVRSRRNADGTAVSLAFYYTTVYIGTWLAESPTYLKRAWHTAMVDGHEVGNHTHSHATNSTTTRPSWSTEITTASTWLTRPFNPAESASSPDANAGIGASADQIVGFRAPYLEYNDAMFAEVNGRPGFRYDSSIIEGFQDDQDGTDYFWPYTLDHGSPGSQSLPDLPPVTSHPGLWEIPVYAVIAPPDERCAEYGIPSGFRARLRDRQSWFDVQSGKIVGVDYNLWFTFRMTRAEFLATMKYTLDLRLQGNRAPFVFGAHSDYYSSKWTPAIPATLADRQSALAELLDYATSKPEVRVTTAKAALDWIRNPTRL
jgi:hypothetical protein